MKKIDPRIVRTRQMLKKALLELIREKGFTAVNIQDITDQAGLNRATFYLHYKDKRELLASMMNEVLDELRIIPPLSPNHPSVFDEARLEWFFVMIFEHVATHSEFYSVLLNEESMSVYTQQLHQFIYDIAYKWANRVETPPWHIPTEMVMHSVSGSFMSVARWWLHENMPYDAEKMGKYFMQLSLSGILGVS